MKHVKLLTIALATIGLFLVSAGKSFGAPGAHKDPVKNEITSSYDVAATVAPALVNVPALEINVCSVLPFTEISIPLRVLEGFPSELRMYRSDHYQVRQLPRMNDKVSTPKISTLIVRVWQHSNNL